MDIERSVQKSRQAEIHIRKEDATETNEIAPESEHRRRPRKDGGSAFRLRLFSALPRGHEAGGRWACNFLRRV